MFLPVILFDRYGWAGFFMFSIPNVLGCTAFGYVLRSPERSKAIVKKYRGALASFAAITIAFHAFFLAGIANFFISDFPQWWNIGLPTIVILLGVALSFLPNRYWPLLATIIWCTSVGIGVAFWPGSIHLESSPTHPWQDIVWLLPITTFGFFLCPYLDPTFHRALQSSPSKHSFGVFGITFALMILLTCMYKDALVVGLSTIIVIHILLQAVFTISAHMREGWRCESKTRRVVFSLGTVLACVIAVIAALRTPENVQGMTNDYLRFFVFYGLIFPSFVAAFLWTKRSFTLIRGILFAFTLLLLIPLLESGYIGGSTWLCVLPVVVYAVWALADQPRARLH
ncbi:MAG: hypothetical protein QGI78_07225 [Phycisphaerales bacterium]|jgi:hypothetical protein|nr:hypothetical protein [Phycisphaerales bacterium]